MDPEIEIGVKTFRFAKCKSILRTRPWQASLKIITSASKRCNIIPITSNRSSSQGSPTIVVGSCRISQSCWWEITLQITTLGRQVSKRMARTITIIHLTSTNSKLISVNKHQAGSSSVQVLWILWRHLKTTRSTTIVLSTNSLKVVGKGSKALQHRSRRHHHDHILGREDSRRVVHLSRGPYLRLQLISRPLANVQSPGTTMKKATMKCMR